MHHFYNTDSNVNVYICVPSLLPCLLIQSNRPMQTSNPWADCMDKFWLSLKLLPTAYQVELLRAKFNCRPIISICNEITVGLFLFFPLLIKNSIYYWLRYIVKIAVRWCEEKKKGSGITAFMPLPMKRILFYYSYP